MRAKNPRERELWSWNLERKLERDTWRIEGLKFYLHSRVFSSSFSPKSHLNFVLLGILYNLFGIMKFFMRLAIDSTMLGLILYLRIWYTFLILYFAYFVNCWLIFHCQFIYVSPCLFPLIYVANELVELRFVILIFERVWFHKSELRNIV